MNVTVDTISFVKSFELDFSGGANVSFQTAQITFHKSTDNTFGKAAETVSDRWQSWLSIVIPRWYGLSSQCLTLIQETALNISVQRENAYTRSAHACATRWIHQIGVDGTCAYACVITRTLPGLESSDFSSEHVHRGCDTPSVVSLALCQWLLSSDSESEASFDVKFDRVEHGLANVRSPCTRASPL